VPVTKLVAAALPIVAIVTFAVVTAGIVYSAVNAGTLGYDFLAYRGATIRILDGQPLYDTAIEQAGGFALFLYPPPFAFAMIPFAWIGADPGTWIWLGASIAMLVGGIALLPVRPTVRWTTLLLAGLSWPVMYAFKLGQVGGLLFLLFALGWRFRDRAPALGVIGALGAMVKVQPGIVLAWALLTRRWRAVVVGGAVLAVAAVVSTVLLGGVGVWTDYVTVLRNVSDPITTPHNFTVGSVAYQMGVAPELAAVLQVATTVIVVAVVVLSALRWPGEASYLVAVIASQLLSPVLWDHYAMLLLLPIAWLLNRGWWWIVVVPLATSVLALPFGQPPILYPVAFWVTLLAVLIAGAREPGEPARSTTTSAPIPAAA
jgi:hypothetical protein